MEERLFVNKFFFFFLATALVGLVMLMLIDNIVFAIFGTVLVIAFFSDVLVWMAEELTIYECEKEAKNE